MSEILEENLGIRTVFIEDQMAARQLSRASLVVVEGSDAGLSVEINQTKTYIGRSGACDLTLRDPAISGNHLVIEAVEGAFILQDLKSTNGTFIEETRIGEVYLHPGCRFRMGSTVVEFRTLGDTVEIPMSSHHRFVDVVGCSVAMRELFATLEKVAPSDLTVLIEGETGSGKERIASSIHQSSRRIKRPYVVLDCGAIPKDLMESVVFGHEKGAFTGAVATRKGVFEQAHGGTIFLDEVGELDLTLQPKLLRLLETREVRRVGSERTIRVDVRVVAATNRDLRAMVGEGTFREDLFFRLSVIQVSAPPLRNRVEDIPLLVKEVLSGLDETSRFSEKLSLTQEAMQVLMEHSWPGNVRELKNVLERASSLADRPLLQGHDMFLTSSQIEPQNRVEQDGVEGVNHSVVYKEAKKEVLNLFERRYLDELMKRTSGNISQAARQSGLTRYHLREMLKRHDLVEKYRTVR